jgi:general stress protein 26
MVYGLEKKKKTLFFFANIDTFIVGSVESSRICIIILSEGQESPHAAPIDS